MAVGIESRRKTTSGRFYEIEDGESYPSVTTILQAIGKPALINWAAKEERELVLGVASELYQDAMKLNPPLSTTAWVLSMESRLGKQRAHQRLLAKAGDLGTQAHQMIEWELRRRLGITSPKPEIEDKALWAFMAWEDWAKAVQLKPLLVEQVIYSRQFGYAGTMDLLCEINVPGLIKYFWDKNKQVPEVLAALNCEWAVTLADWKTGKAIYQEAALQNAAYRYGLKEMGHGDPLIGLIVRLPKIETDPEFEVAVVGDTKPLMDVFLATKTLWTWMQIAERAYQEKRAAAKAEEKEVLSPRDIMPTHIAVPQAPSETPTASKVAAEPTTTPGTAAAAPKKRKRKPNVTPANLGPVIEMLKPGETLTDLGGGKQVSVPG